jgi:hypothetical protein
MFHRSWQKVLSLIEVNEQNRCNQFLQSSLCGGGCCFLSQERSHSSFSNRIFDVLHYWVQIQRPQGRRRSCLQELQVTSRPWSLGGCLVPIRLQKQDSQWKSGGRWKGRLVLLGWGIVAEEGGTITRFAAGQCTSRMLCNTNVWWAQGSRRSEHVVRVREARTGAPCPTGRAPPPFLPFSSWMHPLFSRPVAVSQNSVCTNGVPALLWLQLIM